MVAGTRARARHPCVHLPAASCFQMLPVRRDGEEWTAYRRSDPSSSHVTISDTFTCSIREMDKSGYTHPLFRQKEVAVKYRHWL